MGDSKSGHPKALSSWRLTSPSKNVLEAAARIYGGEVQPWVNDKVKGQWELYTKRNEIPFVVSPIPLSSTYEVWTAGGCQRRCDGEHDSIRDVACTCDPEARQCVLTTRLSIFLVDLPELGVFRLETHGYNAAVELPDAADMLLRAANNGEYIPAVLAIEQRSRIVDGKTKRFAVPAIRIQVAVGDLLQIGKAEVMNRAMTSSQARAIAAPVEPAETVDAEVEETEAPYVLPPDFDPAQALADAAAGAPLGPNTAGRMFKAKCDELGMACASAMERNTLLQLKAPELNKKLYKDLTPEEVLYLTGCLMGPSVTDVEAEDAAFLEEVAGKLQATEVAETETVSE